MLLITFVRRMAPVVAAALLVVGCSSNPGATSAGGSASPPAASAAATLAISPLGSTSAAGGGAAGKVPTHVCDLIASADMTAIVGGSVSRTDPFIDDAFPQCIWHFKDGNKVGTAVNTVLVAFAPPVLFDHNDTSGRVDVPGVGDAAYAYPPGQSVLKSSGAELWVKSHGLVMRIYTVPIDFEILNDPAKTKAWTSQSLALNVALAGQVIAKL
jgi:hypothetical protein